MQAIRRRDGFGRCGRSYDSSADFRHKTGKPKGESDLKCNFCLADDVTERHKIEQAVRDSEERYRLISDTMNDGLSIQNRDGVIAQVNRRFCEITGLSRRELIGRPFSDLLVKGEEKSADIPTSSKSLPESDAETFIHHKDGRRIAVTLKIDYLVDEDGRHKKGRLELADGGTIFLDEIAELSMSMQVKLLRILQEGAFERVGDHHTTRVDVRIISATNKKLEHEMNAGRFRPDLYYRLCVMPILVPPLRERKNDIPMLVDHFFSTIANRIPGQKLSVSREAPELLMA